jgi:hypothetical protein
VRRVVNLIPKNAALATLLTDVAETTREVEPDFSVAPDRDPDGPTAAEFVDTETGEVRE